MKQDCTGNGKSMYKNALSVTDENSRTKFAVTGQSPASFLRCTKTIFAETMNRSDRRNKRTPFDQQVISRPDLRCKLHLEHLTYKHFHLTAKI